MEYILLVVGFVLLVKGADFFVEGSSSVAKLLRVPSVIIGLTIVAFGTSAPELAVSISASIAGSNDIAVGNVIGSNIFNLLMVVGICGLILPMKIDKSILYGDFLFTIVAAVVMLLCKKTDIPYQVQVNRSGMPGGQTLGPIVVSYLPMQGADIGIPMLAMHSARELADMRDYQALVMFLKIFSA